MRRRRSRVGNGLCQHAVKIGPSEFKLVTIHRIEIKVVDKDILDIALKLGLDIAAWVDNQRHCGCVKQTYTPFSYPRVRIQHSLASCHMP